MKLLFITRHYLNEKNGGSLCSRANAYAFASLFSRSFLPAKNPARAIAAKITIIIAYCKNDPKNAISSTCLSAMADTYALQK